jgi:hypothetical protein
MESPRRTVICVLGVHRSGTSLVTRALHLLGVPLGPDEHLMRPRVDNPLGFFEHQPLTDLNDEILWRLGGCWHTPPAFPEEWATSPALDDFRSRARLLLEEDFGSTALWGWKDPRTCLTLPFWAPLLPETRCIICLRNPLDVARSLEARDGFPLERGVRLWVDYLASALLNSTGLPRLFVSYDDLVDRPASELSRIAAFVGPMASAPTGGEAPTGTLTDATLRHHHTQMSAAMNDASLAFPAKALYLTLLLHLDRQLDRREDRAVDESRGQRFGAAIDRLGQDARFAQTAALEHTAAEEERRHHLSDLTTAAHEAAREAAALRDAVAARTAEHEHARNEVDALRTELEASRSSLVMLRLDNAKLCDDARRMETIGGWMRTGLRALLPAFLYAGLRQAYNRRFVWRR